MLTPEEETQAIKLDSIWFTLCEIQESVEASLKTLLPMVKLNDARGFVSLHDRQAA